MPETRYTGITLEQVTETYLNTDANGREAAAALGISFRTFTRVLKHLGIKAKGRQADHPKLRDKEWLIDQYCTQMKSCSQIAEDIGSTRGAVHSSLTHAGVTLRDSSEGLSVRYPQGRFGADASNWRGGRRVRQAERYVRIFMPEHPFAAASDGCVMEHRLVMEKHLGRYLDPLEEVHHKNGIQDDNRLANLEVLSHKEHRRRHSKKRTAAMFLADDCNKLQKEIDQMKKILDEKGIKY